MKVVLFGGCLKKWVSGKLHDVSRSAEQVRVRKKVHEAFDAGGDG